MRLAEWPRNPYLNDELREWIMLHLRTFGVDEVAIYAVAAGAQDEERRVLIATEIGLLDGSYAPRGSTARYALSVRLYPWQAVHRVDLRAQTYRLWAREHQTAWRLRIANPVFDTQTDDAGLGAALAQFAAACAVMAEPAGAGGPAQTDAAAAPVAVPMTPTPGLPGRDRDPAGRPAQRDGEPISERLAR